jgi:hypothetical protein
MPFVFEFAANNTEPPHFVVRALLLLLLHDAEFLFDNGLHGFSS